MTDLSSHITAAKARVDAAQTMPELAGVEADTEATIAVEHWPADMAREFREHRFDRAVVLMREKGALAG